MNVSFVCLTGFSIYVFLRMDEMEWSCGIVHVRSPRLVAGAGEHCEYPSSTSQVLVEYRVSTPEYPSHGYHEVQPSSTPCVAPRSTA